jgi:hypothetical protein
MGENEIYREVFGRRLGRLAQIDSASDADDILEKWRSHDGLMRFRLIYSGDLKSAGKYSRAEDKWAIRNSFSPQLEELWDIHPVLLGHSFAYQTEDHENTSREQFEKYYADKTRSVFREPVVVGDYEFIPLVRRSLHLTCSLDILFLRKDSPGTVISNAGDLDNRIKVLFDGLRMPTLDEMRHGTPALRPLHCLLEDDELITDVSVRTDRLLSRSGASASEVVLVIDVIVRVQRWTAENMPFLGWIS